MTGITFYTDEDVHGVAIKTARHRGVSIVTANEAGMSGAEDEEHFVYAIERGLVLVSANARHHHPLFSQWLADGKDHPGLVLIAGKRQRDSEAIARGLVDIYRDYKRESIKNRLLWI